MSDEKKSGKSTSVHNRHFAGPGDLIVRQGEKGNQAFLIQSGKVKIYAEHDGKAKDLAVLGAGEIFGEMALISEEVRTASAVALENCNLIVITRPMVIEKLARTDPTIRALVPMLMSRIKHSNATIVGRKAGFSELEEAVNEIYKSVSDSLNPKQKVSLERAVQPHFEMFLRALSDFQERYGETE